MPSCEQGDLSGSHTRSETEVDKPPLRVRVQCTKAASGTRASRSNPAM